MHNNHPPKRRVRSRRHRFESAKAFARNLYQGLRVAAFLPVGARAWRASTGQLALILGFVTLVDILLDWALVGFGARFNRYALQSLGLDLAVFLLIGWIVARSTRRTVNPLTIPIALYAASFFLGLISVSLFRLSYTGQADAGEWIWRGAYYGYYAWFLALAAVFLWRLLRFDYRATAVAGLPLVGFVAFSLFVPSLPYWLPPAPDNRAEAEAQAPADSPVSEEILYLQPRLMRQALAKIDEQRAGIVDVYFVGFAPYGEEDVFLKESEVIHKLMDERFDTRGRSLLLVNNNKTLRKYPLATTTNLRAALNRIGEQMDARDDVLVLYLTSHGTEDHRLATDYGPLELTELTPSSLKKMLDDARIRWRVIVVSACFSGGFVEPLRGPNTLVLTAADATHTSFGCGNESDFTYFAKALFDEQLRETYSFEEAFVRAVPILKEREQAAGQEHSNPQMAMGEAMRAHWAKVEKRLRAIARR
jgi:hypothetical protein